ITVRQEPLDRSNAYVHQNRHLFLPQSPYAWSGKRFNTIEEVYDAVDGKLTQQSITDAASGYKLVSTPDWSRGSWVHRDRQGLPLFVPRFVITEAVTANARVLYSEIENTKFDYDGAALQQKITFYNGRGVVSDEI